MARHIESGVLTTAWVKLFTMPNTPILQVTNFIVVNASGSKVNVWFAIMPPGSVTGDEPHAILWSFGINTDDKLEFFNGGMIGPNEQLWGMCDTGNNSISWRVSGDLA